MQPQWENTHPSPASKESDFKGVLVVSLSPSTLCSTSASSKHPDANRNISRKAWLWFSGSVIRRCVISAIIQWWKVMASQFVSWTRRNSLSGGWRICRPSFNMWEWKPSPFASFAFGMQGKIKKAPQIIILYLLHSRAFSIDFCKTTRRIAMMNQHGGQKKRAAWRNTTSTIWVSFSNWYKKISLVGGTGIMFEF